jgi:hypothetical protein
MLKGREYIGRLLGIYLLVYCSSGMYGMVLSQVGVEAKTHSPRASANIKVVENHKLLEQRTLHIPPDPYIL